VNHLIITPILIPLVGAIVAVIGGWGRIQVQRAISLVTSVATLGCAIALVGVASEGAIWAYNVGDWTAPFGITLVLDRLSALMVLLTSAVSFLALLWAVQGQDKRGKHFHFLFQMQVLGINGSFLTGDLFNLFVFFEVLLLASYALLLHGRTKRRLQAGVHYVILNLVGSGMFVFGIAMMYGLTGTLNMADMAARVAELPAADAAFVQAGAMLLLVVFALKAALLPVYMWLPGVYSAASAPVAAVFAILTKVGVYSILRMTTLIFGPDAGVAADIAEPFLLPLALITLVLGTFGALSSRELGRTIAYLIVASMGTMLAAIGLYTVEGIAAGLYYMVHSTIASAALFLLAGIIASQRGQLGGKLVAGPKLRQWSLLGVLFFTIAIAVAGLPPLSGFLGKVFILEAAVDQPGGFWVWGVVLATSLLAVVTLAQAGIAIFWRTVPEPEQSEPEQAEGEQSQREVEVHASEPDNTAGRIVAVVGMLALVVAMTVFAGPLAEYSNAAAEQMTQPSSYIQAILP
jgi:multicomponent K+:H+ antiporter subunit D